MVTVVDPLGTPVPVYNRSGTAIVELPGGLVGAPTLIPTVSKETIVNVTYIDLVNDGRYFILPDDVDVGDVIEVYTSVGAAPQIFPPSGETFLDGGAGAISVSGAHNSIRFRRVTSTGWGVLQSI